MLRPEEYVTTHLQRLDDYITGVLNGSIITGEPQKLAVQRFVNFKTKYDYREEELKRLLKFCSLLNIPLDNKLQQITLLGWQLITIASLYCVYKDSTNRLHDLAYIEISKKNGKTTLCAILSLIDCLIDKELNASVLFVACSKDQARIALDITKGIISNSPLIESLFTINKNLIINAQAGSRNTIEVKANEAKLTQGLGTSLSIVDEYAFATDSELQNKIKSGQIARKNPLQVIITTACNEKQSPAFALRETCLNILNNIIQNDSIYILIFSLDSKEEVQDSKNWIKSNPSIGHTVMLEALEREYETAKLLPDKLNTFMTDNLNLWTDNLTEVWIEDERIVHLMKGNIAIPKGAEVFIGLDLSANSDLASIALLNYDKSNDRFIAKCINIFPNNEKRRIRAGSIDLQRWIDEGYITRCQTPVIDEDLVYQLLVQLSNEYNITSIGIDPWNSKALANRINNNVRTTVNEVRQNVATLSYPFKVMESQILLGKFFIEQSPVVRWMFQNVKVYSDLNNNKKIDKKKGEAVDSIIALNIAMHEYIAYSGMNFDNLIDFNKPK